MSLIPEGVDVGLVCLLQAHPESYLIQMGKEEVTSKIVCIELSVSLGIHEVPKPGFYRHIGGTICELS
jgi:hypothetical protein